MVFGMPPQMGHDSGHLHAISKSVASKIITKHAPAASRIQPPSDSEIPVACVMDMATIIHQFSPKKFVDGRRVCILRTWEAYAENLLDEFLFRECSRGGAPGVEVILAFDKRGFVPPVKAFAHAARGTKNEATAEPVPPAPAIVSQEGAAAQSAVAHKNKKRCHCGTCPRSTSTSTTPPLGRRIGRSFYRTGKIGTTSSPSCADICGKSWPVRA